jgi:adenylate cyclase
VLVDTFSLPAEAVIPFAGATAHLLLCLYILLRRRLIDTTGRLLVAYLLLTALWNINLVVMATDLPALTPNLGWSQLVSYGLIVLGMVYWAFARAFLQRAWIATWGWAIGSVVLALAVILDMGWLVSSATLLTWSNGQAGLQTVSLAISVACWASLLIAAALAAEIQQFQTPSPAHKNRLHYSFISSILLVVGYGMYLASRGSLGTAGLIITVLGDSLLAYTVFVENLVDLGTGARQAASALVVALITVAVYVTGVYLVQMFLGDFLDATFLSHVLDHTLLVASVTALLLTIVYTPIRQISQRLMNRILLGRHYDFQKVIHDYGQAISNILHLTELANAALTHISQTLGVDHSALLMLDSESNGYFKLRILPAPGASQLPESISISKETPITQRLVTERQPLAQYTIDFSPEFTSASKDERRHIKALNFEWFIPILKKKQLIGILGLGHRRSGQAYGAQDLRLLGTLADQTALALENAALFDHLQRTLIQTTHMKNLMDNVFASMANAVITTDVVGKITLFNQAAEMMLGVPAKRCLGHHYANALPFLADTALPGLIANVFNQEAPYSNYEIALELTKRGRVNLSLNLTPLKDAREQTTGVAIVMDDLTSTKRLQAVQNMFRRYVSPAVVDRLPSDPGDLKLGGHRQEITVLFADIRNFTAFSEKLAPEALVDALNQYLSMAAAAILMYEGTLDKFMGDAVMGIFNAPLQQEDHILRAVRSAAAMQRALTDYHHHGGDKHLLSFGIGIHSGEVVVGNVGMPDRMDYTAIGDVVNLTKRIQENTPGGKVLMSETVYQAVKGSVNAMFYEELHVKGREKPVKTYELKWV